MPAPRRRAVAEIENQRLNVRIDPAAYRRLMIHCVMSGSPPGKFLAHLIDTHCREWRVQSVQANPGVSVVSPVSAPLATEVKPNEAMAA
jgi:hypothetical protein